MQILHVSSDASCAAVAFVHCRMVPRSCLNVEAMYTVRCAFSFKTLTALTVSWCPLCVRGSSTLQQLRQRPLWQSQMAIACRCTD